MPAVESSPSRGFTPKHIESLKPRKKRYELADPKTPGLVLRIHPSGVKSFRWYVRSLDRVVVIGTWAFSETPAHVTLAQAKGWLDRLKEARKAGEAQLDVVVAELHGQLEPLAAGAGRRTFKSVAEEFYTDDIKPNRKHPDDVRAMLDQDLLPSLGHMALDAITTLDCRDAIKRVVTGKGRPSGRAAPVHAGKVLSTLKQLFNWAQANGFTERNPAAPLKGDRIGVEANISDRFLSAEEIPIFWNALDAAVGADRPAVQKLRPATAAAMKLLLLTAARTGELLKARWEHVDIDKEHEEHTWTIPVANQKLTKRQEKKARPFVIPLPSSAIALFEELKREAGESPWVMAGDGDSGHYDSKALGHALRRLVKAKALVLPGGPISPHDLRRTARTHLGKLGVLHWIVERCLNHSLGKVVETYDRNDYAAERREALEKWDAYVARLVTGQGAEVVALPARGAR